MNKRKDTLAQRERRDAPSRAERPGIKTVPPKLRGPAAAVPPLGLQGALAGVRSRTRAGPRGGRAGPGRAHVTARSPPAAPRAAAAASRAAAPGVPRTRRCPPAPPPPPSATQPGPSCCRSHSRGHYGKAGAPAGGRGTGVRRASGSEGLWE